MPDDSDLTNAELDRLLAGYEYLPDRHGRVGHGSWRRKDPSDDAGDGDPTAAIRDAWRRDAAFDEFGPRLFTLTDSVGADGANAPADVAKVETLLDGLGAHDLDASDGPTGAHSADLEAAIRGYQKRNLLERDGRIDPDGPTLATMTREFVLGDRSKPEGKAALARLKVLTDGLSKVVAESGSPAAVGNDKVDPSAMGSDPGLSTHEKFGQAAEHPIERGDFGASAHAVSETEKSRSPGRNNRIVETRFETSEWQAAGWVDERKRQFDQAGDTIALRVSSVAGPPTNQFRFLVTAIPLDRNGQPQPSLATRRWFEPVPYSAVTGTGTGSLFVLQANPVGAPMYRWIIEIPPQQAAHGNARSRLIEVFVPKDR